MNQRCPPIVQVDPAVDRLGDRKRSVQLSVWREPNARFHVTPGFSKDGSNAGATGHETGFRSALEIPAARDFCDLSFRRADLDLVCRPDQQAHGRAMAGLAAVEAGSAGPDPGWSALGALQSRLAAFGSRCGDPGCIRRPAWRARSNATPSIFGGRYRPRRRVARQSPRQFVIADPDLDAGQRTKQLAAKITSYHTSGAAS